MHSRSLDSSSIKLGDSRQPHRVAEMIQRGDVLSTFSPDGVQGGGEAVSPDECQQLGCFIQPESHFSVSSCPEVFLNNPGT